MKKSNEFINHLLNWYNKHKRDLPWRQTNDPYLIWMSEVMLQQTQVKTVIPYYKKFAFKYPTVDDLANASESDLLKDWEGLGYYNRIRNFHHAIKEVQQHYNSKIPNQPEIFKEFKGVGPYILGAVSSIAYNYPLAAVDGNVLRVFSRLNQDSRDISKASVQKDMKHYIESFIPLESGDFNQALMELGSTICTPRAPKCLMCPVQDFCQSYQNQTVSLYPYKKKSTKKDEQSFNVYLIINDKNEILIEESQDDLLKGLYAFPKYDVDTSIETIEEELNITVGTSLKYVGNVKHVFTHKVWWLEVYVLYTKSKNSAFKNITELERLPISRAMRKVIELFEANTNENL